MTTLIITVSGQPYSAEVTDAQIARIDANRITDMANLPVGEGQEPDTPIEYRPNYRAHYTLYVQGMVIRSGLNPREALDRIVANVADAPPLTPQEAVALTGDALKAHLNDCAERKCNAISDAGLMVNVGTTEAPVAVSVRTDPTGRIDLLGFLQGIPLGLATTWHQASGDIALTPQQAIVIGLAVGNFRALAVSARTQVKRDIDAGTITTAAQIDAAAWPPNA